MNLNRCKLKKMLFVLVAIFYFIDNAQAQHVLTTADEQQQQQQQPQKFIQPNVEYSPWSPIDLPDYSSDLKINKVRSIQSAPVETQIAPRNQNNNNKFRGDSVKTFNRRNYDNVAAPPDQNIQEKKPVGTTFRPPYKRRTYTTSTSTTVQTPAVKIEGNANRFRKNYRKNVSDIIGSTTTRAITSRSTSSRRPFTARTTESVINTTSDIPSSSSSTKSPTLKKIPFTRGNFRPKSVDKEKNSGEKSDELEGDNYPEHFKQLLKNKEVNTQQNDKSVLKKPIKPFRPSSTDKSPNAAKSVVFPTRQNRFPPKVITTTTAASTSTDVSSAPSQQLTTATTLPKRTLRTRPRPTERTKVSIGSTLQEPPTAKTTSNYATRSPARQQQQQQTNDEVNTETDGMKQIDPPIREYFPRTSAIGSSSALKYSSRFRNSDGRPPSYQPTVPSITTTPALDLNDIDLERWREILPLAAELIHNDAEIMTQSPSQTVSIYEALAEILSKPTESLSFINNKSTDRTLISEAQSTTTTSTTTTTTTTTTTSKPPLQTTTAASKVDIPHSSSSSSSPRNNNTTNNKTTTSAKMNVNKTTRTEISIVEDDDDPITNPSFTQTTTTPPQSSYSFSPKITYIDDNINTLVVENLTFTPMTQTDITTTTAKLSLTEPLLTESTSIFEFFTTLSDDSFNDTTNNDFLTNITFTKNETNGKETTEKIQTQLPSHISRFAKNSQGHTKLPVIDFMTRKISRGHEDYSTPSIFPVYRPNAKLFTTTAPMSVSTVQSLSTINDITTTDYSFETFTELFDNETTQFPTTDVSDESPTTVWLKSYRNPLLDMLKISTTQKPTTVDTELTTQNPTTVWLKSSSRNTLMPKLNISTFIESSTQNPTTVDSDIDIQNSTTVWLKSLSKNNLMSRLKISTQKPTTIDKETTQNPTTTVSDILSENPTTIWFQSSSRNSLMPKLKLSTQNPTTFVTDIISEIPTTVLSTQNFSENISETTTKYYIDTKARRTYKMTTKSPARTFTRTQTFETTQDYEDSETTTQSLYEIIPELINQNFNEDTTRNSHRIKNDFNRKSQRLSEMQNRRKMTTKQFEMTTTDLPMTTFFDYDKLTTIAQVSNPSPFKLPIKLPAKPSPFSKKIPPPSDKVIPLKKYPMYSDYERFAILPNNTVVRKILRDDLHLNYGILSNGTVIKTYHNGSLTRVDDDLDIEITNIDPKSLTNSKSKIKTTNYLTITEQTTKMEESTSLILDLLQKIQNETDTHVKSPNIFSLAKKNHNHHDEESTHQDTPLEFDDELSLNDIIDKPEETSKPAILTTRSTDATIVQPTTQNNIAVNSVSITPNGFDFSTTADTKGLRDSFENEIFLDNDVKTFKPEFVPTSQSTTKSSTHVTSSITKTTSNIPTTTEKTTEKVTEIPTTTTEKKIIQTTTENLIEKNFKILQQLLGQTTKVTTKNIQTTTTEMPQTTTEKKIIETTPLTTTENFIERNYKVLQQLLGQTTKSIQTTTEMPQTTTTEKKIIQTTTPSTTTENLIEKNFKILQQLLGQTTKATKATTAKNIQITTEMPPSTTTTTIEEIPTTVITTTTTLAPIITTTKRRIPTQLSTQATTRYTEIISSMKPIRQTTQSTIASSSPSSIIPSTTLSELITTSTSVIPKTTTYKYTPIQIPSDPPTKSTQLPKKTTPYSDAEDLDFLRQLTSLINGGAIRKPVTKTTTIKTTVPTTIRTTTTTTTTPTTTTTTSTTTTTTTTLPPTTTTTQKIIPKTKPSTFSDSDDLQFLKNLREYAQIINLTTERTNLAQKILDLAMNRTSKSVDSKQSANNKLESMRPAPFVTTSSTPSPDMMMSKMADTQKDINMMSAIIKENQDGANSQAKLSPQEIEKTKQMLEKDLVQYNKDLQLLSLLIGRPLNDRDIAKLATTNLGKTKLSATSTTTTTMQTTSSSSPIPSFKPLNDDENKLLIALQQIQTTIATTPRSTSTTSTTTEAPRITVTRTRSREAIIAELLKSQGIGPENINQVPIEKIIEQLSTERLNREVTLPISRTTTTIRPFSPMPPLRQPRPIIDGLAWLWRTWQETGPGYQPPQQPRQQPQQIRQQQPRPQIQQQRPQQTFQDDLDFDDEPAPNIGNVGNSNTDILSYPSANTSPLGANGFIGAAIGVTRAVTRFLGVALTGAGQVLQVALSGGSSASNAQNLGLFGGSRL